MTSWAQTQVARQQHHTITVTVSDVTLSDASQLLELLLVSLVFGHLFLVVFGHSPPFFCFSWREVLDYLNLALGNGLESERVKTERERGRGQ